MSRRSNSVLRCTLNSFERNLSVVKILPKINRVIFYSTASLLTIIPSKLHPWFITGFADAEACFTVVFQKNPKVKNGYSISLRFKIGLHKKDLWILEQLKSFFNIGGIQSTGKGRDSFEFVVKSLKDITTVIIPHFDKYPLITQKRADYLLFKKVVELMNNKEHLTVEGLKKIVSLKASINNGLSTDLEDAFPLCIPYARPLVDNVTIPHTQWIAGFTSGDGSFSVLIRQMSTTTEVEKFRIVLRFVISQHKRDKNLMANIINYLNCGRLTEYDNMVDFCVESNCDNINKIIPFFSNNNILGVKANDFNDWVKVANLIRSKGYVLNKEDVDKVYQIKSGMNKGRI